MSSCLGGFFLVSLFIGCIYAVVDKLMHYIKKPAITTVAVERTDLTGLPFRALTIYL